MAKRGKTRARTGELMKPPESAITPAAEELSQEAGSLSLIARESAEMRAQIELARMYPRRMGEVVSEFLDICRNRTWVDPRGDGSQGALYRYPRGGTEISGPSVYFAREGARVYGNIRYGLRIVNVTDEYVHIRGFAIDLEKNNYVEAEDRFRKLIYRKGRGEVIPDERDLRELINRRGAICVRNAILQLLPPQMVNDGVALCQKTLRSKAKRDLRGKGREERIKKMLAAFERIYVTRDMLQDYIGKEIEEINEDDLVRLGQVYTSIADGNSRIEDHFAPGGTQARGTVDISDLSDADAEKQGDLFSQGSSENTVS